LILEQKIPKVVVSCLDHTPEVSGKGLEILRHNGVEVLAGILQKEGEALSAIRNTFVAKQRPYIQLKFAQSKDGFMGQPGHQVWISNELSKRLAHKWRSEFDAILVGTATAQVDKPQLTNRHWFGKSLRIVLDKKLALPLHDPLFDDAANTLVVTEKAAINQDKLEYLLLPFDDGLLPKLLQFLFEKRITSLIVEGGAITLQHFIGQGLWDEALVFCSNTYLKTGIKAPSLPVEPIGNWQLASDSLTYYRNQAARR
jgi:diaminohydroxyphosphoribosylaminopyrimidine deaminase/5-amino-6-(5-phosphoribosylamino)uracil reductase